MRTILNESFDENEVEQLAVQSYQEYTRSLLLSKDFYELSEDEQDAWVSATDRTIELVLHNVNKGYK